jgi:hypothetical protein
MVWRACYRDLVRSMSLVLFLIAACGAHRDAGPSWPKLHTADKDGGESLSPRTSASVAEAQSETDDKPVDTPAPSAKPTTPTPAPAASGGSTSTPPVVSPSTTDDPMTTEEIIIEIDGD